MNEPVTSPRSLVALGIALAGCFTASFIGGTLTRSNLDWYDTLVKPGFTPPNAAFPIVWTILYVAMAVAVWLVWRSASQEADKRQALIWFCIQLAIGVLWSAAFFVLHSPLYGLVVIMVLLVTIVITIVLFDRVSRAAALILIPYALWVCFATGLNFAIYVLNT